MPEDAEATTTTGTTAVAESTEAKPVADATETTSAEAKPVETKTGETKDKSTVVTAPPEGEKTAEAEKPKPPEKYDLKLPEGSILDESAIERTAEYAKTQGLSSDAAQELLERHSQDVTDHVEKQSEMWKSQVKADKEIGGDHMKESVEMARRVVDRFGTDTFKRELEKSGFGNHPEVVRIFAKIGKSMGEDSLIVGPAKAAGKPKAPADKLYDKNKTEE